MILVGLGSNLPTDRLHSSEEVLESAINSLEKKGIHVVGRSSWFRSAPVPASDQPWFVNGVVRVRTELPPHDLLAVLHRIEGEYGRIRSRRNASRTLDLDLLAYDNLILTDPSGLQLPHPRLSERAFVLRPLAQVAPEWRHPVSGLTATEMLAALPPGQTVEPIE